MKDRKEYYRNYNKKCKFINLRFNLEIEEERIIYENITSCAKKINAPKSEYIKYIFERNI